MEMEKDMCPVVDVDGFIEKGKQFDLEIIVPEDDRNVIFGVLKNKHGEPISDAVIKLIEVVCDCDMKERRPVSHTFSDKNGEFVFGPLCPDKFYEIQIWSDKVKHIKICDECSFEKRRCLKGTKLEPCRDKNWHDKNWHDKDCHDKDCHDKDCHDKDCHDKDCHDKDCHDKDCHHHDSDCDCKK